MVWKKHYLLISSRQKANKIKVCPKMCSPQKERNRVFIKTNSDQFNEDLNNIQFFLVFEWQPMIAIVWRLVEGRKLNSKEEFDDTGQRHMNTPAMFLLFRIIIVKSQNNDICHLNFATRRRKVWVSAMAIWIFLGYIL